jgi:hypothetical protein
MNKFIDIFDSYNFGWSKFFVLGLLLVLVFLLLKYLYWLLSNLSLSVNISNKKRYYYILDVIHDFIMWYEPIAILIICIGFILVNPILNGLILFFSIVFTYHQIRNYLAGRFIKVNNNFVIGTKLNIDGTAGELSYLGRLGIYLREKKGLKYIPYHSLMNNGFVIVTGENIGKALKIAIQKNEGKLLRKDLDRIKDLLILSPYLDKKITPKLFYNESEGIVTAEVMLLGEEFKSHFNLFLEDQKLKVLNN